MGKTKERLLQKGTELSESLFERTEELGKVANDPKKVDLKRIQELSRQIDVILNQIELINEVLAPF